MKAKDERLKMEVELLKCKPQKLQNPRKHCS